MRRGTPNPLPTDLRGSSALAFLALAFVAALALAPRAAAQRVVFSPEAIVVNPSPSFEVDVVLDRASPDGRAPVYQVGEPVRIGVEVSASAWVYLFDVGPDGQVTQLLPNRFDEGGSDTFLRPGQTRFFPPPNAGYAFRIDGPKGRSKIFVVAARQQLDTRQLARFESDGAFARSRAGEGGFAEALANLVRPIGSGQWVTDAAPYRVGDRHERPRTRDRGNRLFTDPALYAPEGMRVVELELEDDESEAVLVGDLDTLWRSLQQQLNALGWSLRDRERDDGSVEAEYRRGGVTLEIEIEREDDGRVEVEIEREDDD